MDSSFRTADVPEQLLAVVTDRATTATLRDKIRPWFDQVYAFLDAQDITPRGHNVILYWDEGDRELLSTEAGLRVQAGVQVSARFEGDGAVTCAATPGGTVATVTHMGPYSELPHAALRKWCKGHGHQIAGPNWEVYGDWSEDPSQLRTDLYYLLK